MIINKKLENNYIEYLQNSDLPLVLYGAAELAENVKYIMDKHNIKIAYVAIDKEYLKPNMKFHGFDVQAIEDILSDNTEINIILAFIGNNNEERIEQLSKMPNVQRCVFFDRVNIIEYQFPSAAELKAVEQNYAHKLEKLRKQEKINVVFLFWESAKWNADSFYKKLVNDNRFSPAVLLVIPENANLEENLDYIFFKQRNFNVFAITSSADLLNHKPDIVFYEQPWFSLGNSNGFSPLSVSQYALCIYLPYAIGAIANIEKSWTWGESFFRLVYKHFCFSPDCVREYEACGLSNVVATGSAKLDVYAKAIKVNPWRDSTKIKIIYAPHHSFEGHYNFSWATFSWNGKRILQLAKENPQTEWIFKPHPWFKKQAIKYEIFTEDELDEYFREWEKIGQVYDKGDYFDVFRTSDLMITDCNSFLTEYLPTGNPVIYPVSSGETIDERPTVIKKHSQHYYKVYNVEELESAFNMLVNRGEDPLKAERQKDAAEITFDSGKKVYNELLKMLNKPYAEDL